jgi:hypothetical protein
MENDNRMRWIRNLEKLTTAPPRYSVEYEIASECRIPGLLDYSEGQIICAPIYRAKSNDNLTLYNLVLQFPDEPSRHNPNADAKGYYFKDGVVGELLALMSLFYRCRFHLVSSRVPPKDPRRSAVLKSEYSPLRVKCDPAIHPPLFDSRGKNLAIGLADFLNAIRGIDSSLHQRLILACYHYARAVKEVGVDPEMVFIRLVSAIEVLSEHMKLSQREDILNKDRVAALIAESGLSPKEKSELKVVFDVRKSKKKFVRFVEQHCTGYIRGGNFRARHLKIKRKDLPTVLNTIYTARSRYLHAGEPMYLSMTTTKQKWDIYPMQEMVVDNRKVSAAEALPYAHFFEGLVRHCLLKYLEICGQ